MVVVAKPTLACNARCRYCAADSGVPSGHLAAERLPDLFASFLPWLREHPEERVNWIWHGGEPLLLGRDYFLRALDARHEALGSEARRLRFTVQSNLTLLDDSWVPTLRRLLGRGGIGTSFDPVVGWRRFGGDDGAARHDRAWLEAADLLARARLGYGVVYVVHRESLGRAGEIYRWFRNHRPGAGLRVNPLLAEGRARDDDSGHIEPEEYGRFLIEMLDLWLEDGCRVSLQPLSEWAAAWGGDPSRLCCDSRGQCARTHLGLAPDGGVHCCGRGIDAASARHGTLPEDGIEAVLAHPERARIAGRSARLRETRCAGCEWWDLCHGGCPQDAALAHGDPMRETSWCRSRQMVFERMRDHFGRPEFAAEAGTRGTDANIAVGSDAS